MKRLLVVDDETEIVDFLKIFFEERGYQVETASSGDKAIEKAEKFKPQIMLLDVQMPGVTGMTVLKTVKEKWPQIKVIMVTALETRDKIEEAMRLGADNYITKPLSLEYLEKDVQDKIEHLSNA